MVSRTKRNEGINMIDEKVKAAEVSRGDIDWINRRLDRMEAKMRLLTRLLIEKKIIGADIAKSIEETSSESLLDWYIKELKKK